MAVHQPERRDIAIHPIGIWLGCARRGTAESVRPSFVLCAVALVAGGFGIVLYNVALSALAVALLILSLARPSPEPD